jgi:hypothetical protein
MDAGVVAGAAEKNIFIVKQPNSLCTTTKFRNIAVRLLHSELYHKPV